MEHNKVYFIGKFLILKNLLSKFRIIYAFPEFHCL